MSFKQLESQRAVLTAELEDIANQFQLHSLLIMESKTDEMVVFAANQQPVYGVGDAGPKSTNAGCHELYCERVVDTAKPLFVAEANTDKQWSENEDWVKFGLGVYYGVPIRHGEKVIGTVCALNKQPFDFTQGSPSAGERIERLQAQIESFLTPSLRR